MTARQTPVTGGTIYSHFRHLCPYHTWLLFKVQLPEEAATPAVRLLMETGVRHEEQALAYFREQFGDDCIVVSGDEGRGPEDNIRIRAERTLRAMEEGRRVIYHGMLVKEDVGLPDLPTGPEDKIILRGETDFLFRVDGAGEGKFGHYYYEVGDAKSSRTSKFCQQMQVTFYSWLLESIQGARPRFGRILTRPLGIENETVPFREELFLIDDTIWTLRSFLEEELQEILEREEKDFFFHPIGSCETCPYHDYCLERAEASNDLSLLPDIRKIQKRNLNAAGIVEIGQLADAGDAVLKEAGRATGVTFYGFSKLKLQARSLVRKEAVPRGIFSSPSEACLALTKSELDLPGEGAGETAIDITDASLARVYFDMESDPYSSVEYLFGLMVDPPGSRGKRTSGKAEYFTALSRGPDDEYSAFTGFLERMDTIRETYGDRGFAIFHYAHYEPVHLAGLAEKYREGSPELIDRVDYLITRMVDLFKLVKKTYYLPLGSYSIKDVAPCIKSLMEKAGRKGGHEWKKIRTVAELEQELAASGWPEAEISDSAAEVREVMARFELADETLIFDASAEMSVVWFDLFVARKKRVWMKLIEIYNEDDLKATRAVLEWLLFMEKHGR